MFALELRTSHGVTQALGAVLFSTATYFTQSPLGKVPQEAKEKFDFQDTVVINEILLAAAVYCSTKQ